MSKDEAELILRLLTLYDIVWDQGPCKPHCDCPVCKSADDAGSFKASTFESLKLKAEAMLAERNKEKP